MRAVLCNQFGPPEDLVVTEVPDPTPEPGEILIEVKAAPVTFPDTLMLEDKYQFKADLPYVPGAEVAGVVTAPTVWGWFFAEVAEADLHDPSYV